MNTLNLATILPPDKTPAERARRKAYLHIAAIVVFNGILSAIAAYSQNPNGITWKTVAIAVIAQMVLAAIDVLAKFYSASGQMPLSVLFSLVSAEATARAPKLSAPEVAAAQAAAAIVTPQDTAAVAPAVAAAMSAIAPFGQVAEAAAVAHPSLDNVPTVSTLPNIAAIKRP